MLRSRSFSISLFLLCILIGCGKALPELGNFDKESWIKDPNGCLEKRKALKERIDAEKEKMLGLDEMKIVALLGKPDTNQLYKRNQKFFHYYIDPAPSCNKGEGSPQKLVVRFNAMGLAKEIYIE